MTTERETYARSLRARGATDAQIADTLGIPVDEVRDLLKGAKPVPKKKSHKKAKS